MSLIFALLFLFQEGSGQNDHVNLQDHWEEGLRYNDEAQYAKAFDSFIKLMPLYLDAKNAEKYYEAGIYAAYAKLDMGEHDEALKITKKLEEDYLGEILSGAKDLDYAKIHKTKGNIYYDRRSEDKAIESFQKGLDIVNSLSESEQKTNFQLSSLNNIGIAYSSKQQYGKALKVFQEVLEKKQGVYGDSDPKTLETKREIADIYYKLGFLDRAFDLQNANSIDEKNARNWTGLAYTYYDISKIYQRKRDFQTAHEYVLKAQELFEQEFGRNHIWIGHCFHQIGNVYETAKDYEQAIEWYRKAFAHYEAMFGRQNFNGSLSLMNIAKSFAYKGEYEKAREAYEEVHRTFDKRLDKGNTRYIELWLSYGTSFLYNNEKLEAKKWFQKAYDLAMEKMPEKSYDRALSALNMGQASQDHDQALAFFQEALWELSEGFDYEDYNDNPEISQIFYPHWSLVTLKRKAQKLREKYDFGGDLADLRSALSTFESAADLIDLSRANFYSESAKSGLAEQSREVYEGGVDVAFELFDASGEEVFLEKGFLMMEKARSLILLENVLANDAVDFAKIPDSVSIIKQDLETEIRRLEWQVQTKNKEEEDSIRRELFDLRTSLASLNKEMDAKFPILRRMKDEDEVASLRNVRSSLSVEEAIIEYLYTEDYLFRFLISEESAHFDRLVYDSIDIASQLRFLDLLRDNKNASEKGNSAEMFSQFTSLSTSIYEGVLGKDLALDRFKSLTIIPDGLLNYIPFGLLLTESKAVGDLNYKNLPYLLREHPINYAYSSTLKLYDSKSEQTGGGNLIAFAPSYAQSNNSLLATRGGFTSLEYTEGEVESVINAFGGQLFLGEGANEHTFKKNITDADIIHLAMHAYTDEDTPMNSGLIFTENGANGEDDVVYSYELYSMQIHAKLVVLSACNTGGGQFQKGEGVMSLARAFRHAGSPSVSMSLWQVDDQATSELMRSFYTYLKEGLEKDEALQRAKLDYIETASKRFPHFWGAFVIMGSTDPVAEVIGLDMIFQVIGALAIFGALLLLIRRKNQGFNH